MQRAATWILAVAVALAAIGIGGRALAARAMSARAVTPKAMGSATPDSADLPYARIAFESGDRTLIGWWVRAPADSGQIAPAVLFLHGNRSSLSDYVTLQKFLYRQGISSFVFDYSGFGASGGAASLRNAIADAGRAARVFVDSAGTGGRRVALGSALGSTVLLQAIDSVQPHVNGVVVEGTDASVRATAVRRGRIPRFVAPLLVEPADNVAAARRVTVPMLAVHSYDDARAPIDDAHKVVAAVPGQVALVRHWRKGHGALLSTSRPCDWAPVLAFVKHGTLPATKVDTVDACKAEAARLAAARDSAATADSVKAAEQAAARAAASKAAASKATATKRASSPRTKTPATKAPVTKAPVTKAGTTKSGAGTKRPTAPPTSKPS
jgi:pimeloyl-ACP methyl ester carboxylesterase